MQKHNVTLMSHYTGWTSRKEPSLVMPDQS